MVSLLNGSLHYEGKPKFKEWLVLEELKNRITEAAEEGAGTFPVRVFNFLSAASHLEQKELQSAYWGDCIKLFLDICLAIHPKVALQILEPSPEKSKKDPWDYENRTWSLYSHLFAKYYGWSLEYIADLDVEDALCQVQEMLLDEQLEKEFQWLMSDRAVTYDAQSKTSKPNPLPRPYWMRGKVEPPKKTKILKSLLPVGNVDYTNTDEKYRPNQTQS